MPHCITLLVCLSLLAGCLSPAPRLPAPTRTPAITATVPAGAAQPLLTTAEMEYIQLFGVGRDHWGVTVPSAFRVLVAQYETDPHLLRSVEWRAEAGGIAGRLRNARLWFSPESPSKRFDPIADRIGDMLRAYQEAGDALAQAIDQEDAAALAIAGERVGEGDALMADLTLDFAQFGTGGD